MNSTDADSEYSRRIMLTVEVAHDASQVTLFAGQVYGLVHSAEPIGGYELQNAIDKAERIVARLQAFKAAQEALRAKSVQLELV